MFGGVTLGTITMVANVILNLVPKLVDLIRSAEVVYGGLKQGKVKKDYVMRGIKNAIDSGEIFVPKLGKYEDEFMNVVSDLVDVLVKIFNTSRIFRHRYEIDVSGGGNG